MSDPETQIEDETEIETEGAEMLPQDDDRDEAEMERLSERAELQSLKQRATLMGLSFSPNIGLQTLKDRINEKLNETTETAPVVPLAQPVAQEAQQNETQAPAMLNVSEQDLSNPVVAQLMAQMAEMQKQISTLSAGNPFDMPNARPATRGGTRLRGGGTLIPKEVREKVFKEQMKLVRIRVTCMDPKKADLPGEIITVGNEAIGTVKKYVPFGEQGEAGWHVPHCIYTFMKNKKFLHIRTRTDPRTRTPIVESGMVREYAIEVLPPLSKEELQQLARQQAAADSIDKPSNLS